MAGILLEILTMTPAFPYKLLSEEKLFSSSHLLALLLDEKQCIVNNNAKLDQELVFARPNLIGSNFSAYIFPDDFSKYQFLLENALSLKKRSFTMDLRILRGDGIDFEWSRWEFFISYRNKKLKEITGIGHKTDACIDEKKKVEALIRKQNELLETLTFNQSHDMRARLANILGILEIMGHENTSKGNGRLISMLKSEAQKLDNTLKESIALSVNLNTSMEEKNQ
jgi:signal transduction histidine kinase